MNYENYKEALTEVSEILKYMPEQEVNMIPKSVIDFIENNKASDYYFEINEDAPFEDQDLKEETETFLAILNLKYWDKENRDELIKTYIDYDREHQKELRERYHVDIFGEDREENNDTTQEEVSLIEYKEDNIIVKIFKSISKFIKDFFADE